MARSFFQTGIIDYYEVYSPVVRYETFRLLMGIAAVHDYIVDHVDIKTAFIRSDFKDDIYMTPPELPQELKVEFSAE